MLTLDFRHLGTHPYNSLQHAGEKCVAPSSGILQGHLRPKCAQKQKKTRRKKTSANLYLAFNVIMHAFSQCRSSFDTVCILELN